MFVKTIIEKDTSCGEDRGGLEKSYTVSLNDGVLSMESESFIQSARKTVSFKLADIDPALIAVGNHPSSNPIIRWGALQLQCNNLKGKCIKTECSPTKCTSTQDKYLFCVTSTELATKLGKAFSHLLSLGGAASPPEYKKDLF
jgi:hypothetical protein